MAIEKDATPVATDWRAEWDKERRIVAALDELDMWEQERTGLRLWLQGRLRKAVYERVGDRHYDDATSVSLHEILVDEWKPMELAFGERLQGWQDVFDALPHVEQDYRKEAEHKVHHQRYTAAQAARTAAAQQQEKSAAAIDELAEARAARERAQQQQLEEEYRVARGAVDAAVPAVVEALRAAGWEPLTDDGSPDSLHRDLRFRVSDGDGDWTAALTLECISHTALEAQHAEQEDQAEREFAHRKLQELAEMLDEAGVHYEWSDAATPTDEPTD